ncbi:MAG: ATP-binding protein [Candidatus Marinimicrobia bacterium]|nr:ATP-binding protein [Candidatus Neomarinimicrobiota bacterium]MCH7763275.1 ATP-binding protein [Candidatus Neomarinimicrobiota bacterium]
MKRSITSSLYKWKTDSNRKPLILRGARQVGKTYILQSFGESAFPRYHYFNFEQDETLQNIFQNDLNPSRIINELQFHLDTNIDLKHDLVIFDEIQNSPRALTSLKYFYEKMPELALCTAGSLLGVILSNEPFPVGKITFLDLYPMNFEEFLNALGKDLLINLLNERSFSTLLPETAHNKLWELWKTYLIVGGLPEVVKIYRDQMDDPFTALNSVRNCQQDLIETYIADIAKNSGKTNAMHIERIWRNVPTQLARTVDGSGSKFRFKNAIPGIRGFERLVTPITWLEKARLIIRTSIVNRPNSPLMGFAKENRFKQYFFDTGLLSAISHLSPKIISDYTFGTYKGYIAENFVAQEILSAGIRNLYCWEGRTSEVEFLLETRNGIIPLEVKSGHIVQSKSLKVYEEKYAPAQSYVLSGNNIMLKGSRYYFPIYLAGWLIKDVLSK